MPSFKAVRLASVVRLLMQEAAIFDETLGMAPDYKMGNRLNNGRRSYGLNASV